MQNRNIFKKKKSMCFLICGKESEQETFLFCQKEIVLDKIIREQRRIFLISSSLEATNPQKSIAGITTDYCTKCSMVQTIVLVEGRKHFVMAYLQHLVNISALKN